jgi:hypothetical protein
MIARFCLYVEMPEAESPTSAIVRALTTLADEKRWPIRLTGVQYGPDIAPPFGEIIRAAPVDDPQVTEMMDLAKKILKEHKRGDDWQGDDPA